MRKVLLFGLFFTQICIAASPMDSAYKDGSDVAKQRQQNAVENIKNLHPEQIINGYTDKPDQSKYNKGVTQGDTHDLEEEAAKEITYDDNKSMGKAVEDSYKTRPQYFVSPDSNEMRHGSDILSKTGEIVNGKGPDCKHSDICHIDYTQAVCNENTRYIKHICKKYPKVTIVTEPYQQIQHYSGSLSSSSWGWGTLWVPVSGTIKSFSIAVKASDNIWKCKTNYIGYLAGSYISSYHDNCGGGTNALNFSSSSLGLRINSGQTLSFYANGGPMEGQWSSANYNLSILADLTRKKAKVDWIEDCGGSSPDGVCTDTGQACTDGKATKYYDGISVTLDCWNYQVTKQCSAQSDNNCKPLRDKGCSESSTKCIKMLSDICAVQEETYNCPTKKCDSYGIVCNDGSSYCLTGNCSSHARKDDQDAGKTFSALSAIADASKDMVGYSDANQQIIFKGKSATCDNTILGLYNCCRDDGWGVDWHLVSCSDEEKKLGKAKENKLIVQVGNHYCSQKILGVCVKYENSYCVFDSKLARIIQQQGRPQLGISFGQDDKTDCRGLTPDELQRIDFSKIDFTEFYDDIKKKENIRPDGQTEQKISDDINQFYKRQKPHA